MSDFPNLFLPDPVYLKCKFPNHRTLTVKTRVYRERIPWALFLEEDRDSQLLSVNLLDFPLLFSGDRETILQRDLRRREVLDRLMVLRSEFVDAGLIHIGKLGRCHCEVVSSKAYFEYTVREIKRLVPLHKNLYDLARLQRLHDEGKYPA
jgi:hypothetical protein